MYSIVKSVLNNEILNICLVMLKPVLEKNKKSCNVFTLLTYVISYDTCTCILFRFFVYLLRDLDMKQKVIINFSTIFELMHYLQRIL